MLPECYRHIFSNPSYQEDDDVDVYEEEFKEVENNEKRRTT